MLHVHEFNTLRANGTALTSTVASAAGLGPEPNSNFYNSLMWMGEDRRGTDVATQLAHNDINSGVKH